MTQKETATVGSLEALRNLIRMAHGERPTLFEIRRWYIEVVVAESASRAEAAVTLGVNPTTIYRELRQAKGMSPR